MGANKAVNQAIERMGYIDALRGLAMFLVVYHHIVRFGLNIDPHDSIISHLIITVHLPMFFFISGFIGAKPIEYWTTSNYIKQLIKKAILLLIPVTIFLPLFMWYKNIDFNSLFISKNFNGYWFTIVLFQVFCIYFTCLYISNKLRQRNLVYILMIFISIAAYLFGIKHPSSPNFAKWSTFFSVAQLVHFLQFFTCGLICQKYSKYFYKFIESQLFKTISFILLVVLLVIIYSSPTTDLSATYGIYGVFIRLLLSYVELFILFACFYSYRDFFQSKSPISQVMQFTGKRTLDIYMIHFFLLPNIPMLVQLFSNNKNIVLEILILGGLSIAITALCLGISGLLRSSDFLGHYLFGAKSKRFKY